MGSGSLCPIRNKEKLRRFIEVGKGHGSLEQARSRPWCLLKHFRRQINGQTNKLIVRRTYKLILFNHFRWKFDRYNCGQNDWTVLHNKRKGESNHFRYYSSLNVIKPLEKKMQNIKVRKDGYMWWFTGEWIAHHPLQACCLKGYTKEATWLNWLKD